MDVISNAFLSQAEVTQIDRWDYGPLEIHLIEEPRHPGHAEFVGKVANWNRHQCAGFLRDEESLKWFPELGVKLAKNPNIVIAPTCCGYSELVGMLGSLLPDASLQSHGIDRPRANFWLCPSSEEIGFRSMDRIRQYSLEELNHLTGEHLRQLATTIPNAFEQWIWSQLVVSKRFGLDRYAHDSSLRLLAGDTRFWMHRLYRIAVDLYEALPPTDHEEEHWASLDELQDQMNEYVPEEDRKSFRLSRPRTGGSIWYADDPDEREWMTQLLIGGDATVQSLEPIVEVLLGSAVHEDFSDKFSWIKEDFERAFYSKRSKVKIKLLESIDECAVYEGIDTPGYEDLLFRDLMAFYDKRDRSIILALRQGKTRSQIAEQLGHSCHSAISRRVKLIEKKMLRLLKDSN